MSINGSYREQTRSAKAGSTKGLVVGKRNREPSQAGGSSRCGQMERIAASVPGPTSTERSLCGSADEEEERDVPGAMTHAG